MLQQQPHKTYDTIKLHLSGSQFLPFYILLIEICSRPTIFTCMTEFRMCILGERSLLDLRDKQRVLMHGHQG